jgi:hypothetical protein
MAADYEIIAQRQTAEVTATGRMLDVWEVVVIVPEAQATLTVRVPLAASSPQQVDAAVRPRVDQAKAIFGL